MPGLHRLQAAMRQWWMIPVAIVGAVILGWGSYAIGSLSAQADALSIALEQQRGQTEASGQRPVAPPAEQIRENPEIVVETQPLPPTDEQVDAAVARYFRANGVDIPPDLLALELAAHLERNPPPRGAQGEQGEPGEPAAPPTPEQIAAAAERWLTENVELIRGPAGEQGPQGDQGPAGEDGEDGHTPTPEELAELIRAELAKLTLPLCPAGWTPDVVEAVTVDRLTQPIFTCVPA